MLNIRRILVSYDEDAEVWLAESDDLPGLVSEAPTYEALVDRVSAVAPELLAFNGEAARGELTLEFMTTRQVTLA